MFNAIETVDYSKVAVRGTSKRSAGEVAALLPRVDMRDIRALGCPDEIFEFVLEKRAEKRGLETRKRNDGDVDARIAAYQRNKPRESVNSETLAAMELRLNRAVIQ